MTLCYKKFPPGLYFRKQVKMFRLDQKFLKHPIMALFFQALLYLSLNTYLQVFHQNS